MSFGLYPEKYSADRPAMSYLRRIQLMTVKQKYLPYQTFAQLTASDLLHFWTWLSLKKKFLALLIVNSWKQKVFH